MTHANHFLGLCSTRNYDISTARGGRARWQQYVGLLLLNSANVGEVCHWRPSQNVWGKQPWNLDCIRFSFHLIKCQTALTWITYVKCGAIHMLSGARYVFFHREFMGICVVKIWKVTTALVGKNKRGTQRARDPRALLPIMYAAFSFSYTTAGDTKKSAGVWMCVWVCVTSGWSTHYRAGEQQILSFTE